MGSAAHVKLNLNVLMEGIRCGVFVTESPLREEFDFVTFRVLSCKPCTDTY